MLQKMETDMECSIEIQFFKNIFYFYGKSILHVIDRVEKWKVQLGYATNFYQNS